MVPSSSSVPHPKIVILSEVTRSLTASDAVEGPRRTPRTTEFSSFQPRSTTATRVPHSWQSHRHEWECKPSAAPTLVIACRCLSATHPAHPPTRKRHVISTGARDGFIVPSRSGETPVFRFCPCPCSFRTHPPTRKRHVISTEARDGFIVPRAVERPLYFAFALALVRFAPTHPSSGAPLMTVSPS